MATVVRCDICGKVHGPQQTKYVKLEHTRTLTIFDVTVDNNVQAEPKVYADLCDKCFAKLKAFIGGAVNADAGHS